MSRLSRFELIILILVIAAVITAIMATVVQSPVTSGARLVYLGPTRGPYNIWMVDPAQPEVPAQQLTQSSGGIFDFSVTADGKYIAYSEQLTRGVAELFNLDLTTGEITQLTDCLNQDAYCTTPIWRPDGKVIAYQRTELNSVLNIPPGAPRIWLLDMTTSPVSTFPLFQDSQVLGTQPQWSGDGSRLAFYESNSQSVIVYNFAAVDESQRLISIPAGNGSVGDLSPDGTKLVFPELVDGAPVHAVLRMANLLDGNLISLSEDEALTDDSSTAWTPDGKTIALMRVYLDERYTRGYQLYQLDITTQALTPLVVDENYQHSAPVWSPDGSQLAFSRFDILDANAETLPEIWTYTPASDTLLRIVADGFYPRWAN